MIRKLFPPAILALFLCAWCSFVVSPVALAQTNIIGGGMWGDVKVASGGPSVASLFAATATTPTTMPFAIVSGISFSAGVAVVGIAWDQGGGAVAPTGLTINGVAATQIGTKVSDGTTNGVELFYAVVSAGTGTVQINGSGSIGEVAVNGWMITGNSSNTPSASGQTNGFAVQQADPQGPISLSSLAANSVAVGIIGRNFPGSQNPTSWTGVSRDSNAEATNATGNGIIIAGGKASGLSGTVSVSATGAASWQYSGMLAAAWR